MAELNMADAFKLGEKITRLVKCFNSITLEELDGVIESARRDGAMGPLVDPSRWTGEQFKANHQTTVVFQALKELKAKVSGIGNFK